MPGTKVLMKGRKKDALRKTGSEREEATGSDGGELRDARREDLLPGGGHSG